MRWVVAALALFYGVFVLAVIIHPTAATVIALAVVFIVGFGAVVLWLGDRDQRREWNNRGRL